MLEEHGSQVRDIVSMQAFDGAETGASLHAVPPLCGIPSLGTVGCVKAQGRSGREAWCQLERRVLVSVMVSKSCGEGQYSVQLAFGDFIELVGSVQWIHELSVSSMSQLRVHNLGCFGGCNVLKNEKIEMNITVSSFKFHVIK